jgi:hypothetical protein
MWVGMEGERQIQHGSGGTARLDRMVVGGGSR